MDILTNKVEQGIVDLKIDKLIPSGVKYLIGLEKKKVDFVLELVLNPDIAIEEVDVYMYVNSSIIKGDDLKKVLIESKSMFNDTVNPKYIDFLLERMTLNEKFEGQIIFCFQRGMNLSDIVKVIKQIYPNS
ncbi:hypothetical protein EOM39_07510 [Candidatus Gracilibacteria bacterium]|nr:hypothetical protein [Candidatus Gracilibacteria bacterium]